MTQLLQNLKYILPIEHQVSDIRLKTTIKIIRGLYGEKISNTLQDFGWLDSNGRLRPECTDIAIKTITDCIRTAETSGVYIVDGKLEIKKLNTNKIQP